MTDRDGSLVATGGNKVGNNGVGGKECSEGPLAVGAGRGMLCGCSADFLIVLVSDLIGEGTRAILGNDSSGSITAVVYSEGGTGSDAVVVRYSVEAASESRVLTGRLYIDASSAVASARSLWIPSLGMCRMAFQTQS